MKKIIFCAATLILLSSCSTAFNVDSYEECVEKGGLKINSYPQICEYNWYQYSDQSDEYGIKTWPAICEELGGITSTPDNINYFCEIDGEKQSEIELAKEYYTEMNKASLPPIDLIDNNIKNTELSASIRLDSCEELNHDDSWVQFTWLTCWATISNVYKGDFKIGDKINLQYSDHSWKSTNYVDKLLLVSVNSVENNWKIPTFKEPDIAHIFNYSPELEEIFNKASK